MAEATVKKEIIVKRLSAFKFAVEVNTQTPCDVRRQSVIQKAPPAKVNELPVNAVESQTVLIRQTILERIVELLLCKLLGRARLVEFCGYPDSSTCTVLERVVRLSRPNNTHLKSNYKCDGNLESFLELVAEFLNICAPTEQQWKRFGWQSLTGQEILRKIFNDELSPSMRASSLEHSDDNLMKIYQDIKQLLQWEQQGFTAITWPSQRGEKKFSNTWPVYNSVASQPSFNPNPKVAHGSLPMASKFLPRRYNWKSEISMRQDPPVRMTPYPVGANSNWHMAQERRRGHPYLPEKHL